MILLLSEEPDAASLVEHVVVERVAIDTLMVARGRRDMVGVDVRESAWKVR